MLMIGGMVCGVGAAAFLAVQALRENATYFFDPSEVTAGAAPPDRAFRMGGLVVDGSIAREPGSLTVRFDLTDCNAAVPVLYTGLLPDLFGEGQGIVASGRLDAEGTFVADNILTKHDENYMSPEVAEAVARGEQQAGGKCARARVAEASAQ